MNRTVLHSKYQCKTAPKMLCEDVEIGAETYNNMKTESQIKDFTSIRGISAHLKKIML